jgi:hypothetical protein
MIDKIDAKDNYLGDMSSIHNTSRHSFEEVDKNDGHP